MILVTISHYFPRQDSINVLLMTLCSVLWGRNCVLTYNVD